MNENVYSLKFATFVNENNGHAIRYVHEISDVY